jgi:hypothetical protein
MQRLAISAKTDALAELVLGEKRREGYQFC